MSNVLVGLPPFLVPNVVDVTGEQTPFPAVNALNYRRPAFPWRTRALNANQDLDLDFGVAVEANALLAGRLNYPELRLLKSDDNVVFADCTPNMLRYNRLVRRTTGTGAPEAPWVAAGTITSTPDVGEGPEPTISAQRLDFGVGASATQVVTVGSAVASHVVTVSVWLKSSGPNTQTVSLVLSSGADAFGVLSVGSSWEKHTLTATLTGAGTTFLAGLVAQTTAPSVIFGGMQVSLGVSEPLRFEYETGNFGVIVPKDPRTNRRQILLDLTGFNGRYIRYRIPANQTTDDSQAVYETNSLVFLDTLAELGGGFAFPLTVAVGKPQLVTEFESGGREYLTMGDSRTGIGFRGTLASQDGVEAFFQDLAKLRPGQMIVFATNLWRATGDRDLTDPGQAYLTWVTSEPQFNYIIPEVFDAALEVEEVT